MAWDILFDDEFADEFKLLDDHIKSEIRALILLLEKIGPTLGRPRVDTLNGSKYKNMKELRFDADDGVWRVAFAFDPDRNAILLVAGDKSGEAQSKFYKRLIRVADKRFDRHLKELKKKKKEKQ